MDSKDDLLRNGWITLLASFGFIALLALSGGANAAADVGHTVAYSPVAVVTW